MERRKRRGGTLLRGIWLRVRGRLRSLRAGLSKCGAGPGSRGVRSSEGGRGQRVGGWGGGGSGRRTPPGRPGPERRVLGSAGLRAQALRHAPPAAPTPGEAESAAAARNPGGPPLVEPFPRPPGAPPGRCLNGGLGVTCLGIRGNHPVPPPHAPHAPHADGK